MHLDTANTVSVGETDSDVSVVTPASRPGVLDNVMVSSVADSEHSVVKNLTTSLSDDTGGVVTEHSLFSIESHSDGTLVEGGLEVSETNGDREVAGNESNTLGFVDGTASVSGEVRVVILQDSGVLSAVGEHVVLPSTTAAVVSLNTVHILLLRE